MNGRYWLLHQSTTGHSQREQDWDSHTSIGWPWCSRIWRQLNHLPKWRRVDCRSDWPPHTLKMECQNSQKTFLWEYGSKWNGYWHYIEKADNLIKLTITNLQCSPVLTPQITAGDLPVGLVTEKESVLHWVAGLEGIALMDWAGSPFKIFVVVTVPASGPLKTILLKSRRIWQILLVVRQMLAVQEPASVPWDSK